MSLQRWLYDVFQLAIGGPHVPSEAELRLHPLENRMTPPEMGPRERFARRSGQISVPFARKERLIPATENEDPRIAESEKLLELLASKGLRVAKAVKFPKKQRLRSAGSRTMKTPGRV